MMRSLEGAADGMGMNLTAGPSIIESRQGRLQAATQAANDGVGATFSFSMPRGPEGVTDASGLHAIQLPCAMDAQRLMRDP